MVAITAGWALVKLIANDRRAPAGPTPSPIQQRSGFGDKQHAGRSAAHEPGRGRRAATPIEIPARGWKDVVWRVYEEFGNDRIMAVAAGVTYYSLLALFPAIAAPVSVYGLFADPIAINDHLSALSGVLPGGAIEIVGDQVKRIAAKGNGALGVGFVFGLAVSLWSANAGMKAVFDALNIVYDEKEKRSFVRLNLQSLAFTFATIGFLIVAIGGIVAVPIVLSYVGLSSGTEWLVWLGRWPLLLAMVVVGLAVLYRYGPSRDKAQWAWVTAGSLVAAVLWLVASLLLCLELRQLQRNLRLAWSRHRLHDLDLDFRHRRPARGGDQCRDRTSDRPRHDRGTAGAHGRARRHHGRQRRPVDTGASLRASALRSVSPDAPLQSVRQTPASTPAVVRARDDTHDG